MLVRLAQETSKAILAVHGCFLELKAAPITENTIYLIHWTQVFEAGQLSSYPKQVGFK